MDTGLIIAIVIVVSVLVIILAYYFIKWRMENRFRHWLEVERQVLEDERGKIRKEAVIQSRAVLGGKFVEQLTPYLPQFAYDPTEARFIGSPIDLIVFPGLATGDPQEIVIMEIKSGRNCQLTPQERKIRQLVEDGMVRWEQIDQPDQSVE
ncbi:MAG TPA: Holliday junction resolvase [Dehalococcoidia bacterium]|nr:Holliday junction resolvase [Dehalococcoidia bacterium]